MTKKRKKRYSKEQIRAYWIGVGISSAVHKEHIALLESKNEKIRKSIKKGYQDDNFKDVSKRFK